MKKFSFTKNSKIFFTISLIMVVVTVVLLFARGFNLDIEFVGGTELTFDMGKTVTGEDEAKIESMVKDIIGGDMYSKLRIVGDNKDSVVIRTKLVDTETDYKALNNTILEAVKSLDEGIELVSADENTVIFSVPATTTENDDGEEVTDTVVDAADIENAVAELVYKVYEVEENDDGNFVLTYDPNSEVSILRGEIVDGMSELYKDEGINVVLSSTNTVSAEVSSNLKHSAFLATFAAVALMLIYIAFRFQLSSAFAAVICLAHDVTMMILSYLVFQIPVSSTIIAAILTILGYSINATIVIFDRVRENVKVKPAAKDFADNVDDGIRTTIWRSLNTTITTLITIGLVYILGITSIKEFALPLIVGIVAGAYSSICLAGPLWNVFNNKTKKAK